MPARKKHYKFENPVVEKKLWILYSSNREFCFLEEIRLGYFGPNYRCGCAKCDPQMVLPEPSFTQRLDEAMAGRPENAK